MRAIAIIPARYDSTRFKGKPLADLCGRPMLWWVYHQVKKAKRLSEVWVATDHPAIQEACLDYQIPCKMTSPHVPVPPAPSGCGRPPKSWRGMCLSASTGTSR